MAQDHIYHDSRRIILMIIIKITFNHLIYTSWSSFIACPDFQLRPDPRIYRRNLALLEIILGPKPNGKSSRWERAEELLAIDNGDWGLPYITHHCKGIYCCRHGLAETRKKLLLAVLVSSSWIHIFFNALYCISTFVCFPTLYLLTTFTLKLRCWSFSTYKI